VDAVSDSHRPYHPPNCTDESPRCQNLHGGESWRLSDSRDLLARKNTKIGEHQICHRIVNRLTLLCPFLTQPISVSVHTNAERFGNSLDCSLRPRLPPRAFFVACENGESFRSLQFDCIAGRERTWRCCSTTWFRAEGRPGSLASLQHIAGIHLGNSVFVKGRAGNKMALR